MNKKVTLHFRDQDGNCVGVDSDRLIRSVEVDDFKMYFEEFDVDPLNAMDGLVLSHTR